MEKEQIRDNIHRYYDEVFNCKWNRHVRMLELFPMINPNDYILDYGCGVGHISHYFESKYKCNVDAVDISEEEIAKSKFVWEGGGTSKIQFQTINNFDFPTEKYALVFSSQVIEHVPMLGIIYIKSIECLNKMVT